MRRFVAASVLTVAIFLGVAGPAQACGYWDCTEYDGVTVCYWYED